MRNFAEVRADLMDVKSAAFAQIATAALAVSLAGFVIPPLGA